MIILSLNAGSSSLKYSLYDYSKKEITTLLQGLVELNSTINFKENIRKILE